LTRTLKTDGMRSKCVLNKFYICAAHVMLMKQYRFSLVVLL